MILSVAMMTESTHRILQTKNGMKKVSAYLEPAVHAAIKSQAALTGKFMEVWLADAAVEKLRREAGMAKKEKDC